MMTRRRTALLGLVIATCVVVGSLLWLQTVYSAAPAVYCDAPVWNLGILSGVRTVQLQHEFVICNRTADTIPLKKVTADCGCLVAENHPTSIGPSQTIKLPVKITVGAKPGPFRRRLIAELGESAKYRLELRVEGIVESSGALYSIPGTVNFGVVAAGEVRSRQVTFRRYDRTPIDYVGARSGNPAIRVDSASLKDGGAEVSLVLSLAGSTAASSSSIDAIIEIETEHPAFRAGAVRALGKVTQPPQSTASGNQGLKH